MKKPSPMAVALIMKRMKGKAAAEPETEEDDTEEETEEAPIAPTAEVAAFKKLRSALAGEDDAKGAAALKQFLEACGAYEGDE